MSSVIARSWARGEALARARTSSRRPALIAFALYLLFAIVITWPFALHPQTTLFGVIGGDLTGQIAFYQQLADAGRPPFLPWTNPDVAVPTGVTSTWAVHAASAPGLTVMWLLTMAVGGVAMNGLFVLSSFVGSAFAMFLFARWFTGNAPAAFVAGLGFGFAPYVFATASQQLGSGWLLVLLTWRIFVAFERPTTRNAIWAALAMALTLLWVQYWILIGAVWWATLAVCCLFLAWRRGGFGAQLKVHALVGVTVVVVLGAGLALGRAGEGEVLPNRGTTDLYLFSARPLMYVVPSPHHPLVGGETEPFLLERFDGNPGPPLRAAYNPIYLGLVISGLALLGLWAIWARRRDPLRRRERDVAVCLAIAGVVALAFSAPPTIGVLGQSIPMPNRFVAEFTTAFRTTARFGYNVELAACALAAVALAWLLARRSTRVAAAAVAVAAFAVAVDGWARVPPGTTRFTVPETLEALAREPAGTVAFYPLIPANQSPSEVVFYQHFFKQPTLNGYLQNTRGEVHAVALANLMDPRVPQELARRGVRYVVARRDGEHYKLPYGEGHSPFDQATPPRGLEPVTSDAYGALYRVTAAPATSSVSADDGFSLPVFDPGLAIGKGYAQWLWGPSGRMVVEADCDPCSGTLEFQAASYAQGRTLTVTDAATGRVVARRRVEPAAARVRVPLRFSRQTELRLTVDPPGQAAPEILLPHNDTFSLLVWTPEFKRSR